MVNNIAIAMQWIASQLFKLLMHLSMFCPTSPMQEKEGLNQGIILKFCPQGRGISLANTKLLFSLLDSFVTV